jgi:hypothetical protein
MLTYADVCRRMLTEAIDRKLADLNRDKTRMNSNPANKKEWEAEFASVNKIKE